MKEILIIADGNLAKNFLKRVFKLKNIIHKYSVIAENEESLPSEIVESDMFEIHYFDATSREKLRIVLDNKKFDQCIIIDDNEFDTRVIYENLKALAPKLELYLVDRHGTFSNSENKKDNHLKIINTLSITSSRLIGFLPDSPVFADNIGLGKGEIMEVKIPVASSFSYKKVGLLTSAKYSIPIIYRHSNYIITNYNTTILPNDTILVVGEASALRGVYSAIKEENGQFPSPFGVNIASFIDMNELNDEQISRIIDVCEKLNTTLKSHKFFIKVINPTIGESLNRLKSLNNDVCEIIFDYNNKKITNFKELIENHKIGLIVATNDFFENFKSKMYEFNLPVLSIGEYDISEISRAMIVTNGENVTEEASVVFDVASQLNLDVYLYFFNQNLRKGDESFINNYKNLANLFKNDLHIINKLDKNPILALENEERFFQFIPFSEKILHRSLASNFAKDLDLMYYKLRNNYQLFIPVDFHYENS